MSFYFDDDDDDNAPRNNVHDGDGIKQEEFVCFNCGGTDSYIDETGEPCCSMCFTQSQTTVRATQEEMDENDVFGLVARTQDGRIMMQRMNQSTGKGGNEKIGKRIPLETYSRAIPLPSLEHCLLGIQRVLHETSFIVCDLSGVATDGDHYENVLESIKTMWGSYLQAWHEGAEYYGSIYPDVRFSLRDFFLGANLASKILANLSHQVTQRIKKEGQDQRQAAAEEKQQLEGDNDKDDNEDCSSVEPDEEGLFPNLVDPSAASISATATDDDAISACSDLTEYNEEDEEYTSSKTRKRMSVIRDMIAKHQTGHTILKRREAALVLKPSMTMVAAILWLAVSPLGVTGSHIIGWISNGSLPLLNAFRLLKEEEQRYLQPISSFFNLNSVPSLAMLQRTVAALQIACGYKQPEILTNNKRDRATNTAVEDSDGTNSATTETTRSNKKSKNRVSSQQQNEKAGRMITPASVPMVTARLVSDLQFGKTVLNFALALMGLPTAVAVRNESKREDSDEENDEADWLPPSLKAARPDHLVEPAQILGVILVACKLIPGWEKWSYIRPITTNPSPSAMEHDGIGGDGVVDNKNNGKSKTDEERDAKRRKTHHAQRRFVPWNEEHFRLLGNGQTMESYLEFLEEHMVECTNVLLPEFVASLNLSDKPPPTPMEDDEDEDDDSGLLAVRPCPDLVTTAAGKSVMAIQGRAIKRLKQQIYEPCKKHTESRTCSSHPPQLSLLIEYMAYKSGTHSSDIQNFCAELDEEIATRFGCNDQNVADMHPLAVFQQVTESRAHR